MSFSANALAPRIASPVLAAVLLAAAGAAPAAAAEPGWRRIDLPGTGVYALRYLPASLPPGPAPVVVFLHGSGSFPEQWQPFLAPAAEAAGAVVVAPKSASGIGFGPGPDEATIAASLERLGAEIELDPQRLSLAGHSAGGAYAAVLGYAGRLRVAGVFLLGAPYRIVLERADLDVAPPARMVYGSLDPNYQGGHAAAYGEQWDRLGVPWELTVNAGYGHSEWPPETLPDAFVFLAAQRHATPGGCIPSDTRLCLRGGRFAVEAEWATTHGTSGPARVAAARSPDSGLLWFFRPDNWEIQVKILDGCALSGHFWVFASATTNVEYTLTVTDLAGGEPAVYHHAFGPPAPAITDTRALPCP
jgi:poly(3-hydroxybutyrate) depolymerase